MEKYTTPKPSGLKRSSKVLKPLHKVNQLACDETLPKEDELEIHEEPEVKDVESKKQKVDDNEKRIRTPTVYIINTTPASQSKSIDVRIFNNIAKPLFAGLLEDHESKISWDWPKKFGKIFVIRPTLFGYPLRFFWNHPHDMPRGLWLTTFDEGNTTGQGQFNLSTNNTDDAIYMTNLKFIETLFLNRLFEEGDGKWLRFIFGNSHYSPPESKEQIIFTSALKVKEAFNEEEEEGESYRKLGMKFTRASSIVNMSSNPPLLIDYNDEKMKYGGALEGTHLIHFNVNPTIGLFQTVITCLRGKFHEKVPDGVEETKGSLKDDLWWLEE